MKKRFLSILVVLLLLVSNSVPAFCNEVSTDDEAIMNGEDVEYDTMQFDYALIGTYDPSKRTGMPARPNT